MLNGALAGLVAITAEPLAPSPMLAIFIGAIGAIIMYFNKNVIKILEIDDVVGAIPVHMFAGIFGTLVVPFTNTEHHLVHNSWNNFCCSFSFRSVIHILVNLKATIGLRISKEAERLGTDKAEVGVVAYGIRD